MLGKSMKKIKLEEEKPEKSSMYCKINYDLAERIRDYKYHKGIRLDKAMEHLFSLGLKAVEKEEEIPIRPQSVIARGKKRGEEISKSKSSK